MNKRSMHDITLSNDWQHCIFHIISETIESLSNQNGNSIDTKSSIHDANLATRFDLSLKLYSTLLAYCVRQCNVNSLNAIEHTLSLTNICVNGEDVVGIILSHLYAELIESGTVIDILEKSPLEPGQPNERNRALKESARLVTRAVLSNGSDGLDLTSAINQWKQLRHLIAITVSVTTSSGFGLVQLFDYRLSGASAVDTTSGGLHGIRLPEGQTPAILSSEIITETALDRRDKENTSIKYCHRKRVCVVLASQVLSLVDPFLFPDTLDASKRHSQLYGLSLVQSKQPRLGLSQGPTLASLIRLSLILLSNLEPTSVKFLQCCSRLRCFLHWSLELIRESCVESGFSVAFHNKTAVLDRCILCIVLQCHRALSRCSVVLLEIESSPQKYFNDKDTQKKSYKRLLGATKELKEIVLSAFKGRNEVLRASLSLQAYDVLEHGLEDTSMSNGQEMGSHSMHSNTTGGGKSLRAFLATPWVTEFHDVDIVGDLAIPEQVANGQVYLNRTSSNCGLLVMQDLSVESQEIQSEYNQALSLPFNKYLEDHKNWSDTDTIRDLEYEGYVVIKRLGEKYSQSVSETKRSRAVRRNAAISRLISLERRILPWNDQAKHWMLGLHSVKLNRAILLMRNKNFKTHEKASYDLALGKERDRVSMERDEREQNLQEKNLATMFKVASKGIIHNNSDLDIHLTGGGSESEINNHVDGEQKSIEEKVGNREANQLKESEKSVNTDLERLHDEDHMSAKSESTNNKGSYTWAKAFIWSEGERVVHLFVAVDLVSLQTKKKGDLLLTTHGLYFRPIDEVTKERESEPIGQDDIGSLDMERRWRLSKLTEVHGRRYMLRAQALELFFADTEALFVNFTDGKQARDRFHSLLLRSVCKTPMLISPKSLNPTTVFSKSTFTELWQKRKISNFEYLMNLNMMAGRTFKDIKQYPVFPWVIADYTSEKLDLTDVKTFRDFSKPVGALNKDRLSQFIHRYNELDGFPDEEKFLYGSHYSSPGVVLYYLIRQEPFTSMSVDLQSGRFDCPDRLFYDVASTWNGCLNSTSDVKELIPEFFTCPEIFLNTNNFPLGETQTKIKINHVKLPPWANNSPHEFVRLNRMALESEYVSNHLHEWIDLVFGYKQRGVEAMKSNNVFHYLSYEGSVDLDKITSENDRKAIESHIQNFGQTPSQLLLREPHPRRFSPEKCWKPLIRDSLSLKNVKCYTPAKQFGDTNRGSAMSIHVLSDHIIVIYSDLSLGTFKWSPYSNGNIPFTFRIDKIRPLSSRANSTSLTAMNASIHQSAHEIRDSLINAEKKFNWQSSGILDVGNWSFAIAQSSSQIRRNSGVIHRSSTEGFTPFDTSSMLISCGYYDNSLKVHSLDGLRLRSCENGGHQGPINCICVGEDGGIVVSGGQDATCRVWVINDNEMGAALTDGYVQTALGQSDVDSNHSILKCCQILWGHQSPISCLAFSSDLDVVISGSINGTICIHSGRRGKFVRSINVRDYFSDVDTQDSGQNLHGVPVRKLVLDTYGTFVAHLENGHLQSYTVNGFKLACVDAGEKLNVMEIVPGGDMLVTGGESCTVVVRSLHKLEMKCALDLSNFGPIHCIAFSPPNLNPSPQFMFVGTEDGNVTLVCNIKEVQDNVAQGTDVHDIPYTNVSKEDMTSSTTSWWGGESTF